MMKIYSYLPRGRDGFVLVQICIFFSSNISAVYTLISQRDVYSYILQDYILKPHSSKFYSIQSASKVQFNKVTCLKKDIILLQKAITLSLLMPLKTRSHGSIFNIFTEMSLPLIYTRILECRVSLLLHKTTKKHLQ